MRAGRGPRSVVGLRGELTGSRGRSALPDSLSGFAPRTPRKAPKWFPRSARPTGGPDGLGVVSGASIGVRVADARAEPRNPSGERPHRRPCPIISSAARPDSVAFSRREDLRRNTFHPRAQLARRRRQRADARASRDADRRGAAREDQAGVHAALRHGRLRRRRERREDRRHRQQARGQEVLPPHRLPRRHQGALAERHARAPPRGGHPPRGQGHAAAQPPRAQAADEAEGLRRARPPARGAEADPDGARFLMADDRTPPEEQPETPAAPEEQAPAPVDERAGEETPAAEDAPVEVPADEERPHGDPLADAAADAAPAAAEPAAAEPPAAEPAAAEPAAAEPTAAEPPAAQVPAAEAPGAGAP